MPCLPAVAATALLFALRAILHNMSDLATIVALDLNNRCTAFWVAEDTFWSIARLAQLALAFRWIFVKLTASWMQVKAIATFALPPKAAHNTIWVV
jgi:hypothetical protein